MRGSDPIGPDFPILRTVCDLQPFGGMLKPFTYRDLVVWKLGMDLAENCYKTTTSFPKSELYGLTGQLRRASVSIPSNSNL
jgi:hypothetical protein